MGGYVKQNLPHGIPGDEPSLDGGPQRDAEVRIDGMLHGLVEKFGERFVDSGHAGGAPHQDELADLGCVQVRFLQYLRDLSHGPFDEIGGEGLEQLPAQFEFEVEGPTVEHGDSHFMDFDVGAIRQGDLGPFGNVQQPDPQADIFLEIRLVRPAASTPPANGP